MSKFNEFFPKLKRKSIHFQNFFHENIDKSIFLKTFFIVEFDGLGNFWTVYKWFSVVFHSFHVHKIIKILFEKFWIDFFVIFHHNLKEMCHLLRGNGSKIDTFLKSRLFIRFISGLWKIFVFDFVESKGYPFTKIWFFLIILIKTRQYPWDFKYSKNEIKTQKTIQNTFLNFHFNFLLKTHCKIKVQIFVT